MHLTNTILIAVPLLCAQLLASCDGGPSQDNFNDSPLRRASNKTLIALDAQASNRRISAYRIDIGDDSSVDFTLHVKYNDNGQVREKRLENANQERVETVVYEYDAGKPHRKSDGLRSDVFKHDAGKVASAVLFQQGQRYYFHDAQGLLQGMTGQGFGYEGYRSSIPESQRSALAFKLTYDDKRLLTITTADGDYSISFDYTLAGLTDLVHAAYGKSYNTTAMEYLDNGLVKTITRYNSAIERTQQVAYIYRPDKLVEQSREVSSAAFVTDVTEVTYEYSDNGALLGFVNHHTSKNRSAANEQTNDVVRYTIDYEVGYCAPGLFSDPARQVYAVTADADMDLFPGVDCGQWLDESDF